MAISMQRQIGIRLLLVLTLVMGGLLAVINESVEHLTRNYIVTRLQHDAESLLAALQKDADGHWQIDESRLPGVYRRVRSGHYYQVATPDEVLRSRSLWDATATLPTLPPGESHSALLPTLGDESWLIWSEGVLKQQSLLTLWVAEDIAPLEAERLHFGLAMATLILVAAMLLVVLQQLVLRRGFRPLLDLRDAIRALQQSGKALPRDRIPGEVQPLVAEIDRLLEQLEQRIRRSRTALGNVAHELKRPLQRLTVLATQLKNPAAKELQTALTDMQRVLDRELRRARIAGTPTPGRCFVPADDVPHLLHMMERIHPHRALTADYAPALALPQDRDDMLELLGNLLDNACKHAERRVQLAIEHNDTGFRIGVEDDGPGISPDKLASLQNRGVRLDESVEGYGLGLSICRDILDSYGGRLSFGKSPLGGLHVEAELPER